MVTPTSALDDSVERLSSAIIIIQVDVEHTTRATMKRYDNIGRKVRDRVDKFIYRIFKTNLSIIRVCI